MFNQFFISKLKEPKPTLFYPFQDGGGKARSGYNKIKKSRTCSALLSKRSYPEPPLHFLLFYQLC